MYLLRCPHSLSGSPLSGLLWGVWATLEPGELHAFRGIGGGSTPKIVKKSVNYQRAEIAKALIFPN
ncbi:hypothetical protein ACVWZM_000833 [Bradyrhizobium sp. USDA 4501]